MNLTLLSTLLCISWISVSRCQFVEVLTGGEVTLLCTNYTQVPSHILWFILDNRSNTCTISSMFNSVNDAVLSNGFEKEKFSMMSNVSTIFLQIKQVNLSDSGLYICGFKVAGKIFPIVFNATYLKVKGQSDEQVNLPIMTLMGSLIVLLIIIIIALVLKIRKRHPGHEEAQDPHHSTTVASGDVNYAALSFPSRAEQSRRPAGRREPENNTVYATTMDSRNSNCNSERS